MLLLWMIGKMLDAYLVTWCVEQLEDFIECKRKEKRMIRKMTKQDGN